MARDYMRPSGSAFGGFDMAFLYPPHEAVFNISGPSSTRRSGTNMAHLSVLCLTSLIWGLGAAPILASQETASSQPRSVQLACSALPFALGSILAAAFFDPVLRALQSASPSARALLLANLLLLASNGLSHLHPLTNLVVAALSNLAMSAASTLAMTVLLCHPGPIKHTSELAFGAAALGVALRAAAQAEAADAAKALHSRGHLAVSALTLVNAALITMRPLSGSCAVAGAPGTPKGLAAKHPAAIVSAPPAFDGRPPTSCTIRAAFLALVSLAAAASLPAALASLRTRDHPSQQPQGEAPGRHASAPSSPSSALLTACLWIGLAIRALAPSAGPLLSPLRDGAASKTGARAASGHARLRGACIAGLAVLVVGLGTAWLAGYGGFCPEASGQHDGKADEGSRRGGGVAAVLAATGFLAGLALGSAYPRALRTAQGQSGGEGPRMNAVGIVVAYGTVGAVAGVVMMSVIRDAVAFVQVRAMVSWLVVAVFSVGVWCLWRPVAEADAEAEGSMTSHGLEV
ncbi:hypothetical protein VTJ83DRAFT_4586 [Remersonia thermophila]|uniref:Uncharacterized protein n=1 Tax=Remersonia thermophila TaxID=72144 RepID=A0ABR4DAD2_9PEZI